MKTLFLILAVLPAFGQQINPSPICQTTNCYVATTGNVSLNSAATAATIQQPSSCAGTSATNTCPQVYGIKASVYCSVACVVTRNYGCTTAASATAGTVTQSPFGPFGKVTPLLLFFTASNASTCTTIDVTNLGAGQTMLYDLSDVVMGTIPNQNYTIGVGSITGTANITFYVGLK